MSGDLTRLSAAELSEALKNGETTSVELTQAHLDRIAAVDGELHAFLHVNERALEAVQAEIARRRAKQTSSVVVRPRLTVRMPSTRVAAPVSR